MLDVTWDEKRCGYWFSGAGFDFFAYFTSDGEMPDEDNAAQYLECDHVQRKGESFVLHLQVPIKNASGASGIELVETQVVNELRKYWAVS